MSFLSPLFFWSFLSLIPLAAIYLLKVRPRRKSTTAYFLWEEIFQERRPNRLLQRLRDLWSLLLMAIAFCAVCLALTRPEIGEDDRKDVLLLIDNSASMNTVEGGLSRLEKAKQAAIEVLRAFDGTQRAAVASVANEMDYKSHLSDNPRELIDAVKAIEPTDFEFKVGQFTSIAAEETEAELTEASGNAGGPDEKTALSNTDEEGTVNADRSDAAKELTRKDWLEDQRVILVTDGCFDANMLPERVELMKVGAAAENVGFVAADLRRLPSANDLLGLYVRVHSTFAQKVDVDLLVYDGPEDTNLFRLIPLEVTPGLNEPLTFNLENAKPGSWRIKLDQNDALANDNVAQLAVPQQEAIRVQVASENRFFFENSVLAFSEGSGLLTLVNDNPDIVIDQGTWSDSDRAIVFQPQGESKWWSDLGESLDNVVAKVMVEEHPVIRHMDVATVSFAGAVQLTAPEKAQVLVASDEGVPLIYRVTDNGKTAVIVNMDPVVADFYFSAWFPVLVHGSATHLAGREDNLFASYRPGDSIPILGSNDGQATQITLPDSTQIETTSNRLDRIKHVGFYELKNETGSWSVASSLLSQQESNVDNAAVADSSQAIHRGWPLSHWLTTLAVVLLGTESALYHRRKVG